MVKDLINDLKSYEKPEMIEISNLEAFAQGGCFSGSCGWGCFNGTK